MADRTFVLKFLGDVSNALRGVGQLETKLSTSQKVAAGIGASNMLQRVGEGFTTRLMSSAEAASNLNEAQNKANEVFGASVGIVNRFAASSANAFGISRRAALEYAGTFGQVLEAGGMAREDAAGMSVELVQLAADLASFNNISIDDAMLKIRAGLVGESEPLRTVGVLLSENEVKRKAVAMGIANERGELTEAQKVQARYALILEQTKTAQGDFARTSNEMANTQRRLAAEAENAAASIGGPLAGAYTTLSNVWAALPPQAQALSSGLLLVLGGLVFVAGILPSVTTGFGLMAATASAAAGAVGLTATTLFAIPAAILATAAALYLLVFRFDEVKASAQGARDAILGTVGLQGNAAAKGGLKGFALGALNSLNPGLGLVAHVQDLLSGGGSIGSRGELSLEGFANGGVVGGSRGAPRLAVVHGGETITPPGRGGGNIIVQVMGNTLQSSAELQRLMVEALTVAQQRGGFGF